MMNKEQKNKYINNMKEFFNANDSVLVTHYQGLTVNQIDELRAEMRKHGILFKITKNSEYFTCAWLKNCYFGARKE